MMQKAILLLSLVFFSNFVFSQNDVASEDSTFIHVNLPRIFTMDEPLLEAKEGYSVSCISMFDRWGKLLLETKNSSPILENYLSSKKLEYGHYYVFLIVGTDKNGEEFRFTSGLQFYGYSQCG